MSRFSASPIVAAFAAARSQDRNFIDLMALEVAEQIRAFEDDDSQETMLEREDDVPNVDSQETVLEREDNVPDADNVELPRKRKLQHVVSIANRRKAIRWMITEFCAHGKKELLSKAVAHFPEYFRGSYKANHQKVSTWWRDISNYLDEDAGAPALLQRCQNSKVTRVNLKALAGRGRKQSDWVVHVHAVLMDEFLRLQKTRLKFSNALLGSLARDIIRKEEGVFHSHNRDP